MERQAFIMSAFTFDKNKKYYFEISVTCIIFVATK